MDRVGLRGDAVALERAEAVRGGPVTPRVLDLERVQEAGERRGGVEAGRERVLGDVGRVRVLGEPGEHEWHAPVGLCDRREEVARGEHERGGIGVRVQERLEARTARRAVGCAARACRARGRGRTRRRRCGSRATHRPRRRPARPANSVANRRRSSRRPSRSRNSRAASNRASPMAVLLVSGPKCRGRRRHRPVGIPRDRHRLGLARPMRSTGVDRAGMLASEQVFG